MWLKNGICVFTFDAPVPSSPSASVISVSLVLRSTRACRPSLMHAPPGPSWCEGRQARVERSEEHTSELQSQSNLVCRLLLEKKKKKQIRTIFEDTSTDLTRCVPA